MSRCGITVGHLLSEHLSHAVQDLCLEHIRAVHEKKSQTLVFDTDFVIDFREMK